MTGMARGNSNPVWDALTGRTRWVFDRIRRRRPLPPMAGVHEPRRPKPTLPALAVALDEPRGGLRRRIKLIGRRDSDTV